MGNRFKFRAVLKTNTHSIIAEPYYITDNGYFVNIDDVQKPFEKKYPDDCFWEFLEEIEKQENCQEVSTDSEIIIFNSFNGLIQCTGLKDKNGKLIYEGDIVKKEVFIDYNGNGYQPDIYVDRTYTGVVYFNASNGAVLRRLKIEETDNPYEAKKLRNKRECPRTTKLIAYRSEVIGNIYENKELLNEIHS